MRLGSFFRRSLTTLLVGSVVAAACGGSTTPAPAAGAPAASAAAATVPFTAPITMRLSGDWTSLDIQGNAESSGSQIAYAIYDRLVARAADGQYIPYLASSWTVTPTAAKFNLRKDATCADGTPVTPTIVTNSFKRLFDPATPSFNRPRILGPGPYTVAGDDAAGTVSFTFGTPENNLLAGFAHYATAIICPAGLKDPAKLLNEAFGSGPYVLAEAVRGDRAVLKLRKEWKWGPAGATAEVLPEQITIKVIPNATTAANLVVTGGLDLARIDGPDVPRLVADKTLTTFESHGFQSFPMVFNQTAGRPGADQKVRLALMGAVDPKAWSQAAFDGRAIVTASITVPDVPCYDPAVEKLAPQLDLVRSAALLKEAGWTLEGGKLLKDGKQMSLTVISSQTFYQRAAPEYLQAQFNRLGINVTVADTDQPTFLVALRGGNFDVVVVAATGANPQISYTTGSMSGPLPPTGSNYGHITDPELEAGITAALADSTCAGWGKVQAMILQKAHAYPMAAPVWSWFTRGISLVVNGAYPEFWSLRKKK